MIAPEKVELLQRFLGSLPSTMAARLAKAIEVDRLSDGQILPHDLILDGLRPTLRSAELDRTLTPTRVFCRPFEDLLTSRPRKEKHRGRIARDSIQPVWNWLEATLLPEAMGAYVAGVKDAVLGFQREVTMSRAAEIWPVAAEAILAATADEAGRKTARHALGSVNTIEDAREMAQMLSAGPEIVEVQAVLEKPVAQISDDMLWSLRDIYNRIVEKAPDAAPYVAVVVMARLQRPWEALKLPRFVSRQAGDTLIASTDMGLVGEVLFTDLDEHLAVIRAARPMQFDVDAVCGALAGFAELSMGLVKEVEMRRDGKWGQRLMKSRAAAAEALEVFMEKAPREVMAALPTHRASFKGGPTMPDLAKALDPDKRQRALDYARLVAGCAPFAQAASFGAALKNASDEIRSSLNNYNEELLRELRAAEAGDESHAHAEGYFELAVTLTNLLLSQQEGDLFRRRGRAALAPRAA